MKIVFMGTPDFSVPTLQKIIDEKYEVSGVVTQPDKPKGRGKAVQYTPVKQLAVQYGIPVLQPVKIKNDDAFFEKLKKMKPDLIVVIAFGQILPEKVLNLPRYGCINVHASLLPKYRGAAPIQQVILDGEKETGITTMMMNQGLDTGDMLMRKVVAIDKKETGGSLHDKLSMAGGQLLIDTLKEIEEGTINKEKQDDKKATYVTMIKKEFGRIDFLRPAIELERQIRGLNPWPSAFTHLHGKTLKIWDADVEDTSLELKPGMVSEVKKDCFTIMTGEGILKVREIQLEGKKRMTAEAFLRGYQINPGEMLG